MSQELKHRPLLWLATIAVAAVILELGAYVLSFALPKGIYYQAPSRHQFQSYLDQDLERPLGWTAARQQIEVAGYRRAPDAKGYKHVCVSLYGDSYTFASEVGPRDAWGNLLAQHMRCRVDNYGVGGYGTDQAFMRYQSNASDRAPTVILTSIGENIVRNITQNFSFIYGAEIQLKPRFVLDEQGQLVPVTIPRLKISDYDDFVTRPGKLLPQDDLIPGSNSYSKPELGFPYLYSFLKILTYRRVYLGLATAVLPLRPWYEGLYREAHPSRAAELMREIALAFTHQAIERGQKAVFLFIPTGRELYYGRSSGTWIVGPLVKEMRAQGILAYNLGPDLLQAIEGRDICDYFCSKPRWRSGHYTKLGNQILARVVWNQLGIFHTSPRTGKSTQY